MVLIDNNEDYAPAELLVPEPIAIEIDRPDELDRESLQALHWRHKPAANRVLTRGHNYKLGTAFDEGAAEHLSGPRPVVREQAHEGVQRQIIDDPQADPDATQFDGSSVAQQMPLARRLLDAQRVETATGRGRGNPIGFAAGACFEIAQPLAGGPTTRRFLLTRVVHSGSVSEGAESTRYAYENQFECIAADHVYRPPRKTQKPRVFGVQTGIVIGKSPDEIHTDPLGRVRVAFHLHRHAQDDGHSSCWIRVAQIWAGSGYGAMVIPRVGMEVVVAFVDGDPDCPLITGCVYNGKNLPPYDLPTELSKSTFKTSSTPGGDGYSEVRFEDAEGSEQVFVRAQRRMDLRVQGTQYATCTGDREEIVGSQDESGTPKGMHNVTVLGEVNSIVKKDWMTEIEGDGYLTGGQSLYEVHVGRRVIWANELHQITAPQIIAEASDTISQKADLITLAGSDTISLMGGAKLVLESNNAVELRVGNSFISISQNGVDIQGYTIRLNSGGGVGHANEALLATEFEVLEPFEALPADDGRVHAKGSGGGGRGRSRERKKRKYEPHSAPPMIPPALPKPTDAVVPFDVSGVWKSMAWKQPEAWCSEPVSLLFEAEHPSPGDFETAFVQNAADGAVVTGAGVAARHGMFEQTVKLCDVLPRSLPDGVEDSRELNAWLSNGLFSSNSIVFRFISNLPRLEYYEGRSRFAVQIRDHQVEIGSNISYKRGMMAWIISLGDLAAEDAEGFIGVKINGTTDWRYCKEVRVGGKARLAYWDGQGWRMGPDEFQKYHDPLGTKLHGMAVWAQKVPWREEPVVMTQYGTLPWPDEIPEWAPESLEKLERTKRRWQREIHDMWSEKFDLERDQCHGHDPACCRYTAVCNVSFTEVDERLVGSIVIGENFGRANSSAWPADNPKTLTAPHEFGHHLGNPDEYEGAGSVDVWVNGDGAVLGIDEKSIMGDGSIVRRRHFNTVAKALAKLVEQETGKSYTYSAVAHT